MIVLKPGMVFRGGSSRPRHRSSACRINSSSASDGLEEVSEGLQGGEGGSCRQRRGGEMLA